MKKNLFLILICITVLLSCKNNNKYVIEILNNDLKDKTTVYLQESIKINGKKTHINIDSAKVIDGKAYFKGRVDSTLRCYISYQSKSIKKMHQVFFYLEKGKIKIKQLGSQISITGTINNDAYQLFKIKKHELYQKNLNLSESLKDRNLSERDRKIKTEARKGVFSRYEKLKEETMYKNLDNEVGLDFFEKRYKFVNYSTLKTILNNIPPKFNSRKIVIEAYKVLHLKEKTAIGKHYFDFCMQTPNGDFIKISDYVTQNKYVILDFWSAYCRPCRNEIPNLIKLYEKYNQKGLEIIGISLDNDKNAWIKAIKQLNIKWPQMSDLNGEKNECTSTYYIKRIPHLIIINQKGEIVDRGLLGKELTERINGLMN